MLLSVQERLLLLSIVSAAEGNLATLRIVRDLQQELGFSEEEHKAIALRQEDGRTYWDEGKVPPKEVSIGPAALDTVLSIFSGLDQAQSLTLENLPIYERLLKEKHKITSTPKLAAV